MSAFKANDRSQAEGKADVEMPSITPEPDLPMVHKTAASTQGLLRFLRAPRLRSRAIAFLLVVLLHATLLALFLISHARHQLARATPMEVQIIAVASAPPEKATSEPPLALERPRRLHLVTPELPITVPVPDTPPVVSATPDAPIVSASAPAVSVVETAKAPPGPAEPLTAPRFDAAYLKNPAPVYPVVSRRLREQGTVLMRVRVSQQGAALDVLLEHTSGSSRLDEAAIEAVRRWRFVPAHRGSEAVEAWVLVPVEFALQR